MMHGDELRVRYLGDLREPWSGVGHVVKIPDSILAIGVKREYVPLTCVHFSLILYLYCYT